jgi:hypothetical protein
LEKPKREFLTSLITIILAIFAIAVFISSGATILFYVLISIAVAFGFFNVWLISQAVSGAQRHAAAKVQKKRKGR